MILLLCFVLSLWSALSMVTIIVFGVSSKSVQVLFIILAIVFMASLTGLIYFSWLIDKENWQWYTFLIVKERRIIIWRKL